MWASCRSIWQRPIPESAQVRPPPPKSTYLKSPDPRMPAQSSVWLAPHLPASVQLAQTKIAMHLPQRHFAAVRDWAFRAAELRSLLAHRAEILFFGLALPDCVL